MSIQSIKIQNFQSWQSAKLKFDPGVNVVIGPSDSGKSAILRALLWNITNRPSGNSFKSYWGGETFVDLELEKQTISREKGKENLYVISSDDLKKPVEFKAFGQDVPEEISNALNISDINIQRQMDAPFLLSSTPGEVGRVLNQAVRLDIIDKTQRNIASMLRQEKTLFLNVQSTINSKQEDLEKYKWLPLAEGCIAKLESLSRQIQQTTGLTLDLSHVISDINILDTSLQENSVILAYSSEIDNLIALDKDIEEQNNLLNAIFNIHDDIILTEKQITELSKITKAEKQVNELIKTQQDYVIEERKKLSLLHLVEDIDGLEDTILITQENMGKEKQIFEATMPGICPLCGRGN